MEAQTTLVSGVVKRALDEDARVAAPRPKKAPAERRTWSTTLVDGAGSELRVTVERMRDGTWRTSARHVTGTKGKRRAEYGATLLHADEKAARDAQAVLVSQARRQGWVVREARGGYVRKPDAFDAMHLPPPGRARGKS